MTYLFFAYFILWTLFFGYILSVSARLKRVEAELRAMADSDKGDLSRDASRGPS